jgi:hypothetical protein
MNQVLEERLTRNGWSILERMLFSEITWSTWRSLIMSAFFRRFIAKNSPVFLCLARRTRPNDPTITSKLVETRQLC